ncbi:MAG: DMT family transporter [Chitinophagales bacterium]|nr:DMT family transporter [Chitinophagales bacterium]
MQSTSEALVSKRNFFGISDGAVYMLLAAFSFSVMNICIKKVTHIPPMEVVFFRCFTAMLIAFAYVAKQGSNWMGSNRKLLLLRGFFGTVALYTFFLTLQNMPLASAVTIQYLSPIFTTIVAMFLLKEKVKHVQWLFFAISFVGVLFIKGFDSRVSVFYLLVGIVSAVFSAFAYNMVRSLKEKEDEIVVVLHFQIFGAVVGLVFSLFNWVWPSWQDIVFLVLTGIFTHLGQLNLTKSLHREAIASVSILNYTGLIYALAFGFFFFGEIFSLNALVGIMLVVLGVILNLVWRGRKLKQPVVN